jgi:formylglycine-generating enzyme required for sulfatase activity
MTTIRHLLTAACLALLAGTAATHAQGTAKVIRDCATCPTMVQVPAGSFKMGVTAEEEKREGTNLTSATQRHTVTIPRNFLMGRYAVTVEEFAAYVSATDFKPGDDCIGLVDGKKTWRNPGFRQTDRDPVVRVNVADAQAYVNWLSKKTGKTYRLAERSRVGIRRAGRDDDGTVLGR